MPIRYDFRNLPVKRHNYDFRNELRTIGRTEYIDNRVKGRKVDKRWVQGRLTFLGKSQAEFAAYLDIHTSAMTNTLDGTRKLQLTEAPLAAEFLDVPLPRVLAAFGVAIQGKTYGKLTITGYIDASSGTVTLRADVDSGTLEEIDAPFPGYMGCAVKIKGNSMSPRYRDGEAIGYTKDDKDIATLLNHEVVAETIDGRVLLKILHRGDGQNRYTLTSLNPEEAPILNIELAWAAPIDWHLPRRI